MWHVCQHGAGLAENQRRLTFLPLVAGSRATQNYCHDLPDDPPGNRGRDEHRDRPTRHP
jgi:hypothetical protein